MSVHLRRARPDEAVALSALALRSKAWWGYDEAFLERMRPVLTIHPDMCSDGDVVVAVADGDVVGFRQVETDRHGDGWLTELFVAPPWIGHGVGRLLWEEAVAAAGRRGGASLWCESDPHAEGFYLRMGADRVGAVESAPGRSLPVMRFSIRAARR